MYLKYQNEYISYEMMKKNVFLIIDLKHDIAKWNFFLSHETIINDIRKSNKMFAFIRKRFVCIDIVDSNIDIDSKSRFRNAYMINMLMKCIVCIRRFNYAIDDATRLNHQKFATIQFTWFKKTFIHSKCRSLACHVLILKILFAKFIFIDVHFCFDSKLNKMSKKISIVIFLIEINEFSINLSKWKFLTKKWQKIRFYVVIKKKYLKLRQHIKYSSILIDSNQFVNFVKSNWNIIQESKSDITFFVNIFFLNELLQKFTLSREQKKTHYNWILKIWNWMHKNKCEKQNVIQRRDKFHNEKNA